MTELILFASAVVVFVGLKLCFGTQNEKRTGRIPSVPTTPYARYVHAVQAETNRIFAFAQQVCADPEARRVLDEQLNVTGQVDSDIRKYSRLPDPMLTCIVVQDFVMCYRRLGNRVASAPFTWERAALGIVFTRFLSLLKDSGLGPDVWADQKMAMRMLPSYDTLIGNFSQICDSINTAID